MQSGDSIINKESIIEKSPEIFSGDFFVPELGIKNIVESTSAFYIWLGYGFSYFTDKVTMCLKGIKLSICVSEKKKLDYNKLLRMHFYLLT